MWSKLPYNKSSFLTCVIENGYRIYITDFISIWWVHYRESEFLSRLKDSNDDLEMESDNELLQLGIKMLLKPTDLKKVELTLEDSILNISMTMSCGFPLYLEMKLAKGSKEMFAKCVTQKLLKIITDLKTSENELRDLLIRKDKEIEEYKTETDIRLAMYLKTGVYRDEEHMGRHSVYENHLITSEVSNCLENNIIGETEDERIVKQENIQVERSIVKIEADTENPVKNEVDVLENATQSRIHSEIVKREIKNEPQNIISPRKKPKRMLKI